MVRPHFSFWVVAAIGLLWNIAGCLNYILQMNPISVAQMPEIYQVIINGRPAWATGAFMVAVFGGAVGCILLLLRRNVAVYVFLISLIGVLVTTVFTMQVAGLFPSAVLSVLVAGALLWYSTIARRSDWLR